MLTRQRLSRRIALISTTLIAGIFAVYEVVERLWLQDADPDLLRVLHLIRGIGCSTIVAMVIGVYMLRRLPSIFAPPHQSQTASVLASEDITLHQSIQWFIAVRWYVVAILFLATILGVQILRVVPSTAFVLLLATVAGLAFANVIFVLRRPHVVRLDRFLIYQMSTDLLFLTAVLHFSGGIENPFSRVYIFHIVIGAVLLTPRTAYLITALASLLLSALAFGEALGILPHYPIALFPYPHEASAAIYPASYLPFVMGKLSACLLVFWVSAFFCAYLGEQLRLREGALRESAGAMRASEQRLRAIIDSMGAALLLWSEDLRLVWCNQTACEWFRVREDTSAPCVCVTDDYGTSDCAVAAALREGRTSMVERPHMLADNIGRTLRIQAIPLCDDRGRVVQILEVAQDVTEEKAVEAKLLESTKMALVGRMAAAIAHEIGNPLSSMAARLQLIEQRRDSEFVRQSISLFQEQMARIQRLVTNITRFSKPSATQPVPCEITAIMDQVLSMLRMDRRARNVVIETVPYLSIPQVYAIRDHLVQIFLNLGLNALEAMPQGGKLTVRVTTSDSQLSVSFADTGCGLSDEVKSNLFRPFFTTKGDGTGLGLFLSRKIACDLGGLIKVDGEPGKGSRFEVILPILQPSSCAIRKSGER